MREKLEFEELWYNSKQLNWGACSPSMPRVVECLLHGTGSVWVVLQPGDGTRYDLLLTLRSTIEGAEQGGWGEEPSLFASRYIGGRGVGCTSVWSDCHQWDLETVSNSNSWTARVLSWWFRCLWKHIEQLEHND